MRVENDTFWNTEDLANIVKRVGEFSNLSTENPMDTVVFITMRRTMKCFAGVYWISNFKDVKTQQQYSLYVIDIKPPSKAQRGVPIEQIVIESGLTMDAVRSLLSTIDAALNHKHYVPRDSIDRYDHCDWAGDFPLHVEKKRSFSPKYRECRIAAINNEIRRKQTEFDLFLQRKQHVIEDLKREIFQHQIDSNRPITAKTV